MIPGMARRPDKRETEMLSEENLKELRHSLAHLSLPAVRDFYESALPTDLRSDSKPAPEEATMALAPQNHNQCRR
jgi:hypothetical protein